jgi:hypothetical protein
MNVLDLLCGGMILLIGVGGFIYSWRATKTPSDEFQRGVDDARKFLASGVPIEQMTGYCEYMKQIGTAGRYEAGMLSVLENK